jgi:pimeloyl-ACP methyl ester carboxylesterase
VAKISRLLFVVALPVLGLSIGCVTLDNNVRQAMSPNALSRGVVYVADGAGDFRATSAALKRVLAEDGVPLQVRTITWSHGYWRVVADQLDEGHVQTEGWRLAEQIAADRRSHPEEEIYLLGHCAGCGVVLSAAESLPPHSVERIILLAASVPTNYDLRPALRCCREGIDNFYSSRDRWCLGLFLRLGVVAGSRYTPAAGRFGFRPQIESPQDAVYYSRLHQHEWQPEWEWAGNEGGHYDCYQPEFLRLFVLPLLEGNIRS